MSQLLSETRFILFDTETAHQADPVVIELAGLQWRYNQPFSAADIQEDLVDPGCLIDPSSMAVHHIRDTDVAGKPALADVLPKWVDWAGSSPLVAYNSDYDQGVLAGTGLFEKTWLDAYRMAMHCWSIGQLNEDGFALTSMKQQELRYWLKLPDTFGEAHRAAADVQVTAHILHRVCRVYLEDMAMPDRLEDFMAWVNGPIAHLTVPVGGPSYTGKTPDQLEDWALKKAFDPSSPLHPVFKKFNIHDCLRPEYLSRFGVNPPTVSTKTSVHL